MAKSAMLIWILGLFTLVPYGTYYLFFEATRDEYAFVGVSVLFWIFGYWGVVGPLISALKILKIQRTLENLQSSEELKQLLQSPDTKEAAIDLIASENRVPRFIARRFFNLLAKALKEQSDKEQQDKTDE